jgi:outer membrane protein OmpA-like peptidoglycan-associated protein/tetratricopeptide (TPR) repeat protein
MMMNKKTARLPLAGLLLTILFCTGAVRPVPGDDEVPRERKMTEKRADRHFLGQDFHRALSLYRAAIAREKEPGNRAALCAKIARLYFMVRDYEAAATYFGKIMEMGRELPSAADVCDYLDALRFQGEYQRAEAVCLHYAYESVYSHHQRYQNTLNALTMKYDTTALDYSVIPLRLNSARAEYWVGNFMGKPFYAVSRSNFNAPGKIFFHRTRYRLLNEHSPLLPADHAARRKLSSYFAEVPRELQCGPVSFSPDMDRMVATEIVYPPDERVRVDNGRDLSLRARLVYSDVSLDKNRYSRFRPLFKQEAEVSYAHPFLFDGGRSILFTSNMPGGYGGFDLYVSRWDEAAGEWGFPENLGPTVNTEGDEIFPTLFGNELYFASNGHLGLGGYDLFRVARDAGGVVPNSLYHLPYPINSIYNDFHVYPLDGERGYLASDRGGKTRDNLFYYCKNDAREASPDLNMTEQSLLNGDVSPEQVLLEHETGARLLGVVYFDFDNARVNAAAARELKNFLRKHGTSPLAGLHVVGYADEMGRDEYNYRLSERRACAVADWLHARGMHVPVSVEGRGKIVLPDSSGRHRARMKLTDLIERNRRARRVEIYSKE